MSNFIDFARAHGLEIDPSKFYASEKIRRCGTTEKPRSLNGAFMWDGQRGFVYDWSGEARTIWYNDPKAKPWTDEEKRLWASKRASAASEQEQRYQQVAVQADATLRSAKYDNHPYLDMKGFKETRGLVLDERLLIPMRNVVTNKLQGYQFIYWNMEERKYEKKMLTGMRAKNAVLYLGDRKVDFSIIVEGFATALSVRAALKQMGLPASVVCCFSASNMITVAPQIKGRVGIYADNDESKTGEKSAIQIGIPYVMSDTVGHDANDDHLKHGVFYVAKKLMELNFQCNAYK